MDLLIQSSVLGIIQGFTEFLPISSSGHLVVLPKLFGWSGIVDSLEFDVALHLGSSVAVIAFFWREWLKLFSSFFSSLFTKPERLLSEPDSRILISLALASIPAAFVGLLFKGFFENQIRNIWVVAAALIIFAIFLWLADRFGKQTIKDFKGITIFKAVFVGIAQAISLIPGVSRSGVTITAARFLGIDRGAAVKFSFLLSTPAIVGAGLLTTIDLIEKGREGNYSILLVGAFFATLSSLLAIKLLLLVAQRSNFDIFVIYRIVFGFSLILLALYS